MGERKAREVIAELLPFPGLKYDWADEILAALEAEGLRVVRLEQVGERWRRTKDAGGSPSTWNLHPIPHEASERHPDWFIREPLFRIVSDPISPPQEGTE